MSRSSLIRVFEYESLTTNVQDGGRYLTKSELDKLYDYNDRNRNIYFTGIRNGIKFNSYVGVIQIGGLTIEILPKTDRKADSTENEYQNWQKALLDMLNFCHHIKVDSVSEAALEKRYNSILDLYFQLFLDEVKYLLRKGLIKQYRKNSGNLNVVKGRILFTEQIRKNLIHQERVYTEHQVYDTENLYNQILLRALTILNQVSSNPSIKDQIHRIKLDFPEIQEVQITQAHFTRLKENRKTKPYQNALQIAKMIILNYSPDIRNGGENMLALLFDMNKLWEEYIYRVLQNDSDSEYEVSFQNFDYFWEFKTIRPDLVLKNKETEEEYIIDTKWKIIDANNPSDDDLKQMFAYNIYWDTGKSILLYPGSETIEEKFGNFHKGRPNGNQCKVGFINVMNKEGKLDRGIGRRILEKII
ncbi:McrC family protein [Algoriphagus formosus]|uniref:McrC family protein n=1 Tax=Algoriphagus formosus TaxID=2007308 RepID=UPI000C283FD3|nr:restriction endonuclease [Algoriphagus formosus]